MIKNCLYDDTFIILGNICCDNIVLRITCYLPDVWLICDSMHKLYEWGESLITLLLKGVAISLPLWRKWTTGQQNEVILQQNLQGKQFHYKWSVHTSARECCKTTMNASDLQLLAARSPLSSWIFWSFLLLPVPPAGTTSGGPLLWFGCDACCCWCCGWQGLALGLFLSTVKEHVLSVVTTLIIITPPSITAAVGLTAVPPTHMQLTSGS